MNDARVAAGGFNALRKIAVSDAYRCACDQAPYVPELYEHSG